ncbi:hypothetical protein SynBOUM118_01479 [Synechococcus sp. BOUM118]|nr:hypothetical protein SynBOUM118_01479 [Synechococcus sp. BOUM118]
MGSLLVDIRQRNLQPEAWVEALPPSTEGGRHRLSSLN